MRRPAGRAARGTLTLNAPRTGQTSGDMLIDASGALDIQGAGAIVVNAMYRDAVLLDGNDAAGGKPYKYVDQDYLNQRHADSERYMQAALANPALLRGRLAGLNNARYLDALRLRPGLELYAAGDLVVRGDLDLSGHRYDSIDPARSRTALVGSGESGFLTLRAGGGMSTAASTTASRRRRSRRTMTAGCSSPRAVLRRRHGLAGGRREAGRRLGLSAAAHAEL